MFKKGSLLAISIGALAGCNQQNIAIDQESLCEVKGWQKDVTAASCEVGQKVVYLPSSFGNEQLPIIFAAVNCDHRFSIALTKGGVSCIYSPLESDEQKETTN
ncbi:hypothetical protein [Paraglaciecola chathamensis]|uniref:Lipoprotein n=1 Tax=Paraglaciecola chathamensis TaxID=368405 RepID=A0ABS0WHD2_9ALTE|nr:hypothetical protein [Paraglaciecola chathamensis]MBJ2137853.1 hypothetical protein [Paraglaciecola chathamensis]|tara:strand:+ start:233 stop:541 length:309 start_codon:yes stop_codon:yes gene_type:complete